MGWLDKVLVLVPVVVEPLVREIVKAARRSPEERYLAEQTVRWMRAVAAHDDDLAKRIHAETITRLKFRALDRLDKRGT